MTKIEEIKNKSPQQRVECLNRLFKKNKRFFSKKYPALAPLIRSGGASPYHIDITTDFLTITNTDTGELCHPSAGLDRFSEMLGDWTNKAWIDMIEGRAVHYNDHGIYSQMPGRFQHSILSKFPGLVSRMNQQVINLPTLANGKRFSNSVVFAGIFHGLHVDHYLSRTQILNAAFFEPNRERFVLSCYFLDYQNLEERFNGLVLHVGDEFPHVFIESFLSKAPITAGSWVRVLTGYASDEFDALIRQLRLCKRNINDTWHPAEWRIAGFENVMTNISAGDSIYAGRVPLSSRCKIAVIGAGPSLSSDLNWLKQNCDQFVIFAVHSAISALKSVGVVPDFQFSLDINSYSQEDFDRIQFDPSVPIVAPINDIPDKYSSLKEILRLPELGGSYPVLFERSAPFMSPTSGNMALAFACLCHPAEVSLFGLDFGFRQSVKTHVAESSAYQTDEDHKSIVGAGYLKVEANFSDAEEVYAQPYFNSARMSAQKLISKVPEVKVVNCSDGARIEGAFPCRSSAILLSEYDKAQDVALIRSMFTPLTEGINWTAFELDGSVLLDAYKKVILSEFEMKKFNWFKFVEKADKLDSLVKEKLPKKIARQMHELDSRMEPYLRVVNDLLRSWYRLLCFTDTEQEWQQVYVDGYSQLTSLIGELEWPSGLP